MTDANGSADIPPERMPDYNQFNERIFVAGGVGVACAIVAGAAGASELVRIACATAGFAAGHFVAETAQSGWRGESA